MESGCGREKETNMSINRGKFGAVGFTMVELLVIIGIISILVTILIPSLQRAMLLSQNTKSRTFVNGLQSAAQSYKNDTNYFPGIRYPKLLLGYREGGSQTGSLTGSQVLATSVLGLYYKDVNDVDVNNDKITNVKPGAYTAVSYLTYNSSQVLDGTNFDLSDQFSSARPLLYYPSIPGNTGSVDSAFRFDDNNAARYSTFGIGARQTQWKTFITHPSMTNSVGQPMPWNYDTFIIIGPSMDKIYFTNDDVKNF